MDLPISKQVSATFTRNNFSKVTKEVLKEGYKIVIKKSKPVMVMMSLDHYQKITKEKPQKKTIKLEDLKQNSIFAKYDKSKWKTDFEKKFKQEKTSYIIKNWANYVD